MLIKADVDKLMYTEKQLKAERQRLLLIENGFPSLFAEGRAAQILANQRRKRYADKSGR